MGIMHPATNKSLSIQLTALEQHLRAAHEVWQAIEATSSLLPGSYVAGGDVTHFAMRIRPNKMQISSVIYKRMVESFTARWPEAVAEEW
jgi:hypothetical protein